MTRWVHDIEVDHAALVVGPRFSQFFSKPLDSRQERRAMAILSYDRAHRLDGRRRVILWPVPCQDCRPLYRLMG